MSKLPDSEKSQIVENLTQALDFSKEKLFASGFTREVEVIREFIDFEEFSLAAETLLFYIENIEATPEIYVLIQMAADIMQKEGAELDLNYAKYNQFLIGQYS